MSERDHASSPQQSVGLIGTLIASVIGALAAWGGFLALIFSLPPDPQLGIAVFLSPVFAGPVGVGAGALWAATWTESLGVRVVLVLLAVVSIGAPCWWLYLEIAQMLRW